MANKFVSGTLILTLSGFVVKAIGSINWIILSRILGGEGIGIYQMAFPSLPRKISSNPYVSRVRARFLQNNIHLLVKAVCQISCFAVHLWYKA